MKKLIIATVCTAALITTGFTFAQELGIEPEKKQQRHHRQQRGIQAMPAVDQLIRAVKRLDLDDEQKQGIRAIMAAMKAEVRPVMREIKAGHLQLKELIKADTFDEAAVTALAEKEGALAAERVLIASRTASQVLKLLTDEQRGQLETMAAERRQRRGEKHKKRAG
jgi:Spy/CpxP family protein refolding chaperone